MPSIYSQPEYLPYAEMGTRDSNKMQNLAHHPPRLLPNDVPFGVTYEKIGTIQRRLAWPLHKDDTLSRSGRSTDLNIYFLFFFYKQPRRSMWNGSCWHLRHGSFGTCIRFTADF